MTQQVLQEASGKRGKFCKKQAANAASFARSKRQAVSRKWHTASLRSKNEVNSICNITLLEDIDYGRIVKSN